MVSRIVDRLTRRDKPGLTVMIGMGRRHAPDSAGMAGPEEMGAPAPGHGTEGGHEQAYSMVMEGLQELSADYPEAATLLQQFEQMWEKWMGASSGGGAAPVPASTAAEQSAAKQE
jgi:hypothetical protein